MPRPALSNIFTPPLVSVPTQLLPPPSHYFVPLHYPAYSASRGIILPSLPLAANEKSPSRTLEPPPDPPLDRKGTRLRTRGFGVSYCPPRQLVPNFGRSSDTQRPLTLTRFSRLPSYFQIRPCSTSKAAQSSVAADFSLPSNLTNNSSPPLPSPQPTKTGKQLPGIDQLSPRIGISSRLLHGVVTTARTGFPTRLPPVALGRRPCHSSRTVPADLRSSHRLRRRIPLSRTSHGSIRPRGPAPEQARVPLLQVASALLHHHCRPGRHLLGV